MCLIFWLGWYYDLNICVPPAQFICLNLSPNVLVLKSGAFQVD